MTFDHWTRPEIAEPSWLLLGLLVPGSKPSGVTMQAVQWIGLFRAMEPDAGGQLQPRTWRDYRGTFFPGLGIPPDYPWAEEDYTWLVTREEMAELQAQWAAEALAASVASTGAHEGTAEARHDAPPPHQEGPTRPGGTAPADSVTVGRDRHHFPDGTGNFSSMVEARRQPMLLWRSGHRCVRRQPAEAARALGPCHPVYFCSLAPYRPNRAERPPTEFIALSGAPVGGDFPTQAPTLN